MADIAKSGRPSLASKTPAYENQIPGKVAGEALAAGDTVYLAADGRWMKTVGSAVAAAAAFLGMIFEDAAVGEPVTPYRGVRVRYGAGLTPGTLVYRSPATAGALADANATVTAPIGIAVGATEIQLFDIVL